MFLARRPFRNGGKMVSAGSVVEPADIRRFKHQLRFGNIIEVAEERLPYWVEFFKTRYGVDVEVPTVEPVGTKEPETKPVAKPAVTKAQSKKKPQEPAPAPEPEPEPTTE